MGVRDKVSVVMGGGGGIGSALARRSAEDRACGGRVRGVAVDQHFDPRGPRVASLPAGRPHVNAVPWSSASHRRGSGAGALQAKTVIEPEAAAESVMLGLRREQFLILRHPEEAEYFRRKADDNDRWLGGMRRMARQYQDGEPPVGEQADD